MSSQPPPAGPLDRLARFTTRRARLVLAATVLLLAAAVALGADVAQHLRNGGIDDPGSQSVHAGNLIDRDFPGVQANLLLLVTAPGSVDAPATAAEGRALTARLAAEPGVTGATSYWVTHAAGLRSHDGRQALVAAQLTGDQGSVNTTLKRVEADLRGRQDGVTVQVGGSAAVMKQVQDDVTADLVRAEAIALPVTLLVLVVVFGSAVAALLPLSIGVVAILGTNAVLRGITLVTDVSVFAQNLTTALGLGLAIDYALLIVRRYREELRAGRGTHEAVHTALRTAGRTVLFSAATVAVALSALLVFPQYFLRSMAYAGISVVVLAAGAALVVLPALLALLGPRVDALDIRRLVRRGRRDAVAGEPGALLGRLTANVLRFAPAFAAATLALLVALGLPFLRVHFGTGDDRQLPAAAESRVVQQHVRDDFSGNPTGTLDVIATGAAGGGPAATAGYARELSQLPHVIRVESPSGVWADGRLAATTPADAFRLAHGAAHLTVVPSVDAVSTTGQDLVGTVRAVPHPGYPAYTTGLSARLVDDEAAIGRGLPWALTIVALATVALVFLLTGSVLIPLQAVLLNALSLTAMLGAVVWVFQDGHLSGLLGFTATGTIETSLPVLMCCVAFGLSMDYGVFLLSRIKEEHDRTGDHEGAIATGVRRTGGVITAAALILAVVLVGIGTSRISNTKMLGLGVALAVLMDAMVVRTLLVPAVLKLTGRAAWWAPGPLRRLHTRVGLREETEAPREYADVR
jgi:RND superfamily putative drug exporter